MIRSIALMTAALAIGFAGCNQGPKIVPVKGQVLIDGKPLTYGNIRLVPETGRTAFSPLDKEGRFELMTDDTKGCPVGTHKIEIGSVEMLDEYHNRRHAPEVYESAANSGLTATIDGPKDDLKIDLTWGGQRPPF
jgi:hypothetical protein